MTETKTEESSAPLGLEQAPVNFNEGLVRDFIDVYIGNKHWPTFNVADSLLCIGVGLLIVSTFLTEKSSQKHAQQHK